MTNVWHDVPTLGRSPDGSKRPWPSVDVITKIWIGILLCLVLVVALTAVLVLVLVVVRGPLNIQVPLPTPKAPNAADNCSGTVVGSSITCQHVFCADVAGYPSVRSDLLPQLAVVDSPPALRQQNLVLWHEWHDSTQKLNREGLDKITMAQFFAVLRGEAQGRCPA